jgi:hypothetical protein
LEFFDFTLPFSPLDIPSSEPKEDCLMAGMMLAKADGLLVRAVSTKRVVLDGNFGGNSSSPELDWEDGSSRR